MLPMTKEAAAEELSIRFLELCAERGYTTEEVEEFAADMEKRAQLAAITSPIKVIGGKFMDLLKPFANNAANLSTLALIGGPLAVGALGGHMLAGATEDETGVDRVKADEEINTYHTMADHLRRQQALRRLHTRPGL